MSGSLKRALGLWVASKAPGLHVYSDDLANQTYLYPSCTVAEIDHAVTPLGCGKKDYKVRDPETHFVTAVGRVHQAGTSFRLTFRSPHSTTEAGQEIVDELLATIELAALTTLSDPDPIVLTDSVATPAVVFSLEVMKPAGRAEVPADVTGEPFLFGSALTLRLVRLFSIERSVEHVIETIIVEDD